jgi:DNA polymerase
VTRPLDVVIDFLRAQQAQGVTHVHLDPDTRAALRHLELLLRRGANPSPTPLPPPANTPADTPVRPAKPAARPAVPARAPGVSRVVITGETLEQRLACVRQAAENWEPARALGTLRQTMVFATGDPASRLMFVGEAPGHDEELKGEPFVGHAGRKLDQILVAMGLGRRSVYISNICKFRPATPRQTTNNRSPDASEIAACLPLIQAEIDLIRPACIVALGGTAAKGLLGVEAPVGSLRGTWHDCRGIPVRVTYHPSYLLRQDDLRSKRQVWEDMLAVMERLSLPISDRQRGFFLSK